MQEEQISAAAKQLQYQQKRDTAQNFGHDVSTPGFALAIRDRAADRSIMLSAPDRLRQAISAIKRATELTSVPAYHTIMPSAVLLRDAPIEAAELVAAAHAASVSVLTWTVRQLPVPIIVTETPGRVCKQDCCSISYSRWCLAGR